MNDDDGDDDENTKPRRRIKKKYHTHTHANVSHSLSFEREKNENDDDDLLLLLLILIIIIIFTHDSSSGSSRVRGTILGCIVCEIAVDTHDDEKGNEHVEHRGHAEEGGGGISSSSNGVHPAVLVVMILYLLHPLRTSCQLTSHIARFVVETGVLLIEITLNRHDLVPGIPLESLAVRAFSRPLETLRLDFVSERLVVKKQQSDDDDDHNDHRAVEVNDWP